MQGLRVPGLAVLRRNGLAFGVDQDALVRCQLAVPDVDDVVAHFLAAVGGAAQDARHAFVVENRIPVPVTAEQQLDIALLDRVHQLEIVEDRSVLRIVVHQDHGLFAGQRAGEGIEPRKGFVRNQGRRHAHVRPAVAAQELDAARLEFELFVAEYLGEGVAAALRPFGVVVARHDPIWMHEFVEHLPCEGECLIRPEIRQVTPEYRELDVRLRIDIGNTPFQIVDVRRPVQRNMDIAKVSKLHRRGLCRGA